MTYGTEEQRLLALLASCCRNVEQATNRALGRALDNDADNASADRCALAIGELLRVVDVLIQHGVISADATTVGRMRTPAPLLALMIAYADAKLQSKPPA